MQKIETTTWKWIVVAVLAVILAAPNGTIIKTALSDIGPIWFNVFRFIMIVLLTLPFVIHARKSFTRKNIKYAAIAGVSYGVAVVSYTLAVQLSQASYVATIDLGIPILLMVYSIYLTREKVSRHAFVGIGLAALGGFVIIALPSIFSGDLTSDVYPLATLMALLNCASFPLAIIYSRKANEAGLSLWPTFGVIGLIVLVGTLCVAFFLEPAVPSLGTLLEPSVFWAILYSAIFVTLLSRLMTVASYERVGSATVAGLHYVESFLAITLPIIILSERMTIEMLIGGCLILSGVMLIETKHRPRLYAHRKHGFRR